MIFRSVNVIDHLALFGGSAGAPLSGDPGWFGPLRSGAAPRPGRELDRVERAELAALLRAAARLRSPLEPLGSLTCEPDVAPAGRKAWGERAIDLLRRHRLGPESAPLAFLRALLETELATWPDAESLARAAFAVESSLVGALSVARARLGRGDAAGARDLFAQCLRADPPERLAWRAWDGLACAHEQLGSDRLARGSFGAAAESGSCGAAPLVSHLFLVLELGVGDELRGAVARLELCISPGAPDFRPALGRLLRRVAAWRGLPWEPSLVHRSAFRSLAARRETAAGRVCFALERGWSGLEEADPPPPGTAPARARPASGAPRATGSSGAGGPA